MIFPLGYNCAIVNLNIQIKIKAETTLFEWFQVEHLQNITDVLEYLYQYPNENVIHRGKSYKTGYYVYINNENIKSLHYNYKKFETIFRRRYKRFLEHVLNSSQLWFVRYNIKSVKTNKKEIESFIKVIRKFNSKCILRFILIDTVSSKSQFDLIEINEPNVIFKHDFFLQNDTKLGKPYLENNKLCSNKYKKILDDMNYPFENK